MSPGGSLHADAAPPAVADDQMSLLQKLDAWGKGVVRNALASKINAPQTTWTLAARPPPPTPSNGARAINALSAAPPSSAPL